MVQPWWAVVAAAPLVVAKGFISSRGKKDDDARVCTSKKMLKKLGDVAKLPTLVQMLANEPCAPTHITCQRGMSHA
eukprot:gene7755-938_t